MQVASVVHARNRLTITFAETTNWRPTPRGFRPVLIEEDLAGSPQDLQSGANHIRAPARSMRAPYRATLGNNKNLDVFLANKLFACAVLHVRHVQESRVGYKIVAPWRTTSFTIFDVETADIETFVFPWKTSIAHCHHAHVGTGGLELHTCTPEDAPILRLNPCFGTMGFPGKDFYKIEWGSFKVEVPVPLHKNHLKNKQASKSKFSCMQVMSTHACSQKSHECNKHDHACSQTNHAWMQHCKYSWRHRTTSTLCDQVAMAINTWQKLAKSKVHMATEALRVGF